MQEMAIVRAAVPFRAVSLTPNQRLYVYAASMQYVARRTPSSIRFIQLDSQVRIPTSTGLYTRPSPTNENLLIPSVLGVGISGSALSDVLVNYKPFSQLGNGL